MDVSGEAEQPVRDELIFVAKAYDDLKEFPREVQREIGHALAAVQFGGTPAQARTLQGFHGASVQEIRENGPDGTYRAVYTVRFSGKVYVLHCFQKKSASGIKTSPADMEIIRRRLREVVEWERGR